MVQTPIAPHLLYPDSDGKPIAENTVQYDWIVALVANLKHLLKGQRSDSARTRSRRCQVARVGD